MASVFKQHGFRAGVPLIHSHMHERARIQSFERIFFRNFQVNRKDSGRSILRHTQTEKEPWEVFNTLYSPLLEIAEARW